MMGSGRGSGPSWERFSLLREAGRARGSEHDCRRPAHGRCQSQGVTRVRGQNVCAHELLCQQLGQGSVGGQLSPAAPTLVVRQTPMAALGPR